MGTEGSGPGDDNDVNKSVWQRPLNDKPQHQQQRLSLSQYHQSDEYPVTPISQPVAVISPFTYTRARRSSKETHTATCSSSSSLYEMNVNLDDNQHDQDPINTSSFMYQHPNYETSSDDEYYDDDETDNDLDIGVLSKLNTRTSSVRKSNELFREWDNLAGTRSPTQPSKSRNARVHKSEYFSSPTNDSSTPIFKRLVSKNTLKPQLKSFRRITNDLQTESIDPLENEIYHEKLILSNIKNEENSNRLLLGLGLKSMMNADENAQKSNNSNNNKKFDIIKKANENWNLKKHANFLRPKTSNETLNETIRRNTVKRSFNDSNYSSAGADSTEDEGNSSNASHGYERKRSFDTEPNTKYKRRAVSTSPISTGFFKKRGNIKLVSNASKDLEKMSLE